MVPSLPSGELLSLQVGGRLVPGIVPIARSFAPFSLEAAPLLQYQFTGIEPKGTYTWMSVLTAAGTWNVVSPIQERTFSVQ